MHGDCSYLDAGRLFHGSVPMVMGTRFDMVIPDIAENAARLIWKDLCDWLEGADALLNRFDEGSEVARINSGASGQPSADLAEWIATGERYSTLTEGLFSVRPCGKLDFGGLAKGAAVRYAKGLLESRGVLNAFVDFGGSAILGLGHHPYGPEWKVSVQDPFGGGVLQEVGLCNQALSTSGNSPVYSGHIVNPFTGEKCYSRRVVTVISHDPLDAEVLSTVLMIASEKQKKEILSRIPSAKVSIFEI